MESKNSTREEKDQGKTLAYVFKIHEERGLLGVAVIMEFATKHVTESGNRGYISGSLW